MSKTYKDILYEVRDGVVRVTINRPEVYNAFRNQTLEEMIDALRRADEEKSASVMVLSGAGDKSFCTGGDQKVGSALRGTPEAGTGEARGRFYQEGSTWVWQIENRRAGGVILVAARDDTNLARRASEGNRPRERKSTEPSLARRAK